MIRSVEATQLGKRYGETWALRDCSIRIPAGRIAGLVGPNGAGKTTLLQLAAGLRRPSAGEIRVFGRSPVAEAPLIRARVGFMAQDAPLYGGFSVEDMLRFGRKMNARWDQGAAESRLRNLNIPFDRRIGALSGGQRSQVALSLVLGKRPELLLLDEPVARLDPLARREFLQGLTEAVAEDGMSVLLSSHLLGDLERLCDYLVIVARGQVQLAGDIETLVAEHRLLVGPRTDGNGFLADVTVVRAQQTDRQSSVWVRGSVPHLPPGWREAHMPLEELVILYLATPAPAPVAALELEGSPR
jgi:ABC-type multidrug transport system ATPase subunit